MEISVNLAVDESADFEKTVALAKKKGLKVHAKHEFIKVASGKIEQSRLRGLAAVKGIKTIEEDREVRAL